MSSFWQKKVYFLARVVYFCIQLSVSKQEMSTFRQKIVTSGKNLVFYQDLVNHVKIFAFVGKHVFWERIEYIQHLLGYFDQKLVFFDNLLFVVKKYVISGWELGSFWKKYIIFEKNLTTFLKTWVFLARLR